MTRRPEHRDERGAVAVLVALLALALVGMSAFAVDFGMAYANKRQAQTAADAAALSAAMEFGKLSASGGCEAMRSAGQANANTEALAKLEQNDDTMIGDPNTPGGVGDATLVGGQVQAACTTNGLEVTVQVATTSPNVFGRVTSEGSKTDEYTMVRSAKAIVEAAGAVGAGLRPLALCSRDLLPLTTFPTPVMRFVGPGTGNGAPSDCPGAAPGGNWWTLNCPENANNGDLAANIAQGCKAPVAIVPNQPAAGNSALRTHLLNYCTTSPTRRESCFTNNPGNLADINSADALEALVVSGKTIYFPVFCGTPTCSPGAVTTDAGNNTIYPVFRLVAGQLCGFHLGNSRRFPAQSGMTGACANNPQGFNPMENDNGTNYLLISIKQMQVSGGTKPSGCKVGDPCDTGLRQVRMTG